MKNEAKKMPRGVRMLPEGRLAIYATKNGKPMRHIVTWELLDRLKVAVGPTRLTHPGIKLAELALTKLKASIQTEKRDGVVQASALGKRVMIKELFPLIRSDHAQRGLKDWLNVEGRWEGHLRPFFGEIATDELTTDHVNEYIRRRQEKAENATINRETSVLKRMLRLGARAVPPMVRSAIPHIPKLKENAPRKGFMQQAEYDLVRPHAHGLWLRGLLATAYSYGDRRGELLGLRVRQVDAKENFINLEEETKNGEPRTLAMTSEVRALMLALIEGKEPDDHVFTRTDSKGRLKPVKDFRKAWRRMFEDAGVPRRHFHDMRRSAIRNMIRRGVDRDTARQLSGHKTDAVFSRYNIQDFRDAEDAALKIERGAEKARAEAAAAIAALSRTDKETDNQGLEQSGAEQVVQ
jgi:integrase